MIGRRRFLQLGSATLSGAPFVNWDKALGALKATQPKILSRGIFDERFTESRIFGNALAARGLRTSAIGGDIASLWYGDLRDQLRQTRVPFAGLTERSALFCLEELARDVGMRVVTRIDHTIDSDGVVRHEVSGPTSVKRALQQLDTAGNFGRLSALLVMQHDSHQARNAEAQKRFGPMAPANTTALVTWAIA
jgi:hypothetical protein